MESSLSLLLTLLVSDILTSSSIIPLTERNSLNFFRETANSLISSFVGKSNKCCNFFLLSAIFSNIKQYLCHIAHINLRLHKKVLFEIVPLYI